MDKDYPKCTELQAKSDFAQPNPDCAAGTQVIQECSNANDHQAGATTTTDANGCTVTTTWSFSGYPTCTWIQKQDDKTCPIDEEEPIPFECPSSSLSRKMPCGCNGTKVVELECRNVGGTVSWIIKNKGECSDKRAPSECAEEKCSSVPDDERECVPGQTRQQGGNMCSVRVFGFQEVADSPAYAEEQIPAGFSDEYDRGNGNKMGVGSSNSSNLPNYKIEQHDLGWTCSDACKWVKNPCPDYTSGGGGTGGGGGGGTGGGGGSGGIVYFEVQTDDKRQEDSEGGSFMCCATRTVNNGFWTETHLVNCITASSIEECTSAQGM